MTVLTVTGLRRRAFVDQAHDVYEVTLQTRVKARWVPSGMVRSALKGYAVSRAMEWVREEPEL